MQMWWDYFEGRMKVYKKKIADRYDISGLVEAQFEPGSCHRVLKNLLGIRRKREMDRLEGLEQLRALRELIKIYGKSHQFAAADICRIHRIWLKISILGQESTGGSTSPKTTLHSPPQTR